MNPTPSHILLVRLSAMGDVAMVIPVLRAFFLAYPATKVTVVSKAFHQPLFKEFANVTFYPAEVKGKHKGVFGILKLADELKKHGIDAVADLHDVLRSKVLRAYFKLHKIPVAHIDKGRAEKKALTRAKNKRFQQLPHTVDRYAAVFERLGFKIDVQTHIFPTKQKLTNTVASFWNKKYTHHIGIAPFAAFEGKTYPLDLMEEVIATLSENESIQLLLFGGKGEEKTLKTLSEKYNNTLNMAGKLSFEEELALISNLNAMLAMDSGNAHLAAIYGVPAITIWGATHPYAGFYPFLQSIENALLPDRSQFPLLPTSIYGNKLPKGYEKAIATITPQQIVEKIKKVL